MGCNCQGSNNAWTPPAGPLPSRIAPRRGPMIHTTQMPVQPPAQQKP
jgi:hypothetical protein